MNGTTGNGPKERVSVGSEPASTMDWQQSDQYASSLPAQNLKAGKPDRRKPGYFSKKWLKYDKTGATSMVKADKTVLVNNLGLQTRDLRIVDPQLTMSYPSAVLCREKALVVNLEQIKCICTSDYVLVVNPEDKAMLPFIEKLHTFLQPTSTQTDAGKMKSSVSVPNLKSLQRDSYHSESGDSAASTDKYEKQQHKQNLADDTPFELRALEVVLDFVSSHLEQLAADLESSAHPALDSLTKKITTNNLERVRRIKNRLARLTTRVETVRELLEKILDDDSDLRDMNLTARTKNAELARLNSEHRSLTKRSVSGGDEFDGDRDGDKEDEVEEVEMVIEPYFMRIDNTYNKLRSLEEYIGDTEDYINIELDSKRNSLIKVDLLMTTTTMAMGFISAVGSIFGMNLENGQWLETTSSYWAFALVSVLSSAIAILLMIMLLLFLQKKKLLRI